MKFKVWLESRMFEIPAEAKTLLPSLRERIKELSEDDKWIGIERFAELEDTFSDNKIPIYLIDYKNYYELGFKGCGSTGTVKKPFSLGGFSYPANTTTILYKIPMHEYDTIYHELTHAYDPQSRKGISKQIIDPSIGQVMTTPHEQLAVQSARFNDIKNTSKAEKEELKNWLRQVKTEDDLEQHNLPRLLNNMSLFVYFRNPKLWRQFTSRLWNAIQ